MTWIEISLSTGAKLLVEQEEKMPWIKAAMSWPGLDKVEGEKSASLNSALISLNMALCDDAAKEMLSKGAA